MILLEQLSRLAEEANRPSVTISINTNRVHPENQKDIIKVKNNVNEAKDRLLEKYDKKDIPNILKNLEKVLTNVEEDYNYHLDSLNIFLSETVFETVKLPMRTDIEGVHISDKFAIRPLLKNVTSSMNYLIMLLSQNGAHLYEANDKEIVREIKNDNFPYPENPFYNNDESKKSDSEYLDDLVREFLNNVDKAAEDVYDETHLKCIVVCTEDNYSRLLQVANKPEMYIGYAAIDYNNVAENNLVEQVFPQIEELRFKKKHNTINSLKELVTSGTILTDLQEIYRAAIDGQGELLMVHNDFQQAVKMEDERNFNLVEPNTPGAINDIVSTIAWQVFSKKGKVIFTSQEDLKDLGNKIVLKTRY